jgi:exopolysaccharide biosynthesis polyprenyl glycosylphosphotransferase
MGQHNYQRNLVIPSIKILFDIIAIETAVVFSYWFRFHTSFQDIIPVDKGIPNINSYIYFSIFLVLIFLILFSIFQAYRTRMFSTFSQDITVIFKVCFLGILFAMSSAFLYREFSYSRLVFLLIFFNTNIFLIIGRLLFHQIKKKLIKKGYDIIPICLIGSAKLIPEVFQQLKIAKEKRFKIEGYIAASKIEDLELTYLGQLSQLSAVLDHTKCSALTIAFDQYEYHHTLDVIKLVEGKNIEIFFVPDILGLLTSSFNSIESEGLLLLQLKAVKLSGWQGFIKRVFDISISFFGAVFLSPLLLLLALLVKLTSRGPVFYLQNRIGLDGKEFNMLKFRSMMVDAEAATGPVWAKKGDPRVTPIGSFLRRTSLDELPQLINVLLGDMSLVGPRPERPHFVSDFQNYIPQYAERHRVRSGVTGWAQVNGLRGQSPIEERTKYDIYYIENWSLWFDLKIIILTFLVIIRGENAY